MKRKFKALITAFAVCAVSAFAVAASSCGGVPDWLEEARCEHVLIDGEVTKKATCTQTGEMVKECTLCTYTETVKVPMTEHTEIILNKVEATCTKSGLTEGKKCADCGEILTAQKTVSPKGHTTVTDPAVAPTCTETGLTKGSHCHDCGEVFLAQEEIAATGHNPVDMDAWEATCEKDGYTGGTRCVNCGEVFSGNSIPALGHSYGEPVIIEPSCSVEGSKIYTCSVCDGEKVEVLEKVAHTYEFVENTVAPTCSKEGTALYQCTACASTYTEKVDPIAHDYVEDVCTMCGIHHYEADGLTLDPVRLDVSGGRPALVYDVTISKQLKKAINDGVYTELGYILVNDDTYGTDKFHSRIDMCKTIDYIGKMELLSCQYTKNPVSLTDTSFRIANISASDVNDEYLVIPYVAYEENGTTCYRYASYPTKGSNWEDNTYSVAYLAVDALNNKFIQELTYEEAELNMYKKIVHESCALILGATYSENTHFYIGYNYDMVGKEHDVELSIDYRTGITYELYAVNTYSKAFKKVTDVKIPMIFYRVAGVVSDVIKMENEEVHKELDGGITTYVVVDEPQFIVTASSTGIGSIVYAFTGIIDEFVESEYGSTVMLSVEG